MSQPLVSAIVSTYNSEQFIEGKILDLLEQSIAKKLEIIIVNSGSQQDEDFVIQKYLRIHDNIKYIKTDERETVYKAWNRGIRIAKGKYICNSNADDRLRKDAYEIMINYLENDLTIGLVYADQYYSYIHNQTFDDLKKKKKYPKPDYNKLILLERCIIGSQPMWRKSIHEEHNIWFNEKYEIAGDYDFELKISRLYKIKHIPQYLGVYYKSPQQTNKEFQNFENTFNETVEIMTIYLKEFIIDNSKKISNKYFILFFALTLSPPKIYNLVKSIIRHIYPRKEIPSLEFLVWYISFVYEYQGKQEKAIQICSGFNKPGKSNLLSFRLKQLKKAIDLCQ